MHQTISGHNSKLTKDLTDTYTNQQPPKMCNCTGAQANCPLDNRCLEQGIIYQATVTQPNSNMKDTYVGLTADPFKMRYNNHKKSFKHEKYSTETTLSQHLWTLKRENSQFDISWKIIDRGKSYSPTSKVCQLCTKEKYIIIFNPEISSLNSRNEIGSKCGHKARLLLKNN